MVNIAAIEEPAVLQEHYCFVAIHQQAQAFGFPEHKSLTSSLTTLSALLTNAFKFGCLEWKGLWKLPLTVALNIADAFSHKVIIIPDLHIDKDPWASPRPDGFSFWQVAGGF